MPKHEPVHKLPYIYELNDPYSRSEIFVVCQSADPKIMGYISHALVQKDLEYFIHAGNAYPKMVKLFQDYIRDPNIRGENPTLEQKLFGLDVAETLKEIGEME